MTYALIWLAIGISIVTWSVVHENEDLCRKHVFLLLLLVVIWPAIVVIEAPDFFKRLIDRLITNDMRRGWSNWWDKPLRNTRKATSGEGP